MRGLSSLARAPFQSSAPRQIAACPVAAHKDVVATVHRVGTSPDLAASLFRVPPDESVFQKTARALEPLGVLAGHAHAVQDVAWHPSRASSLASVDTQRVRVWDVEHGKHTAAAVKDWPADDAAGGATFAACAWNPHHGGTAVAALRGRDVDAWDTRTFKCVARRAFSPLLATNLGAPDAGNPSRSPTRTAA